MNKNGVSTTTATEQEQFETFTAKGKTFVQYDYRSADGKLFSIVKPSLELCRQARDKAAIEYGEEV